MVSEERTARWRESSKSMLQAVILALFIRTFMVQAYKIPSRSMQNTLFPGDHIFVSKCLYGIKVPFTDIRFFVWRRPRRPDVIVFQAPHELEKDYIKRCVGEPGDTLSIREKQVYIDGMPIKEPYAVKGSRMYLPRDRRDFFEYGGPLPEDHFLMLGDNRDNSKDSRFWGHLPFKYVKGKALFIYWPLSRIQWVK